MVIQSKMVTWEETLLQFRKILHPFVVMSEIKKFNRSGQPKVGQKLQKIGDTLSCTFSKSA